MKMKMDEREVNFYDQYLTEKKTIKPAERSYKILVKLKYIWNCATFRM